MASSGKFDVLHDIYSAHLKTPQAREEIDERSALVKPGRSASSAMSATISTVTVAGSLRSSKDATASRWKT